MILISHFCMTIKSHVFFFFFLLTTTSFSFLHNEIDFEVSDCSKEKDVRD